MVEMMLMAARVQMIDGMVKVVSGVEGGADEAGGEGAAEVEEHEVAGEDAAAHFIRHHLNEQLG